MIFAGVLAFFFCPNSENKSLEQIEKLWVIAMYLYETSYDLDCYIDINKTMEKLMDLNKTKRSESMRKLPLDKHKIPDFILSKRPRDNPLTLFIDEIIQHLIQIIEVLLQ